MQSYIVHPFTIGFPLSHYLAYERKNIYRPQVAHRQNDEHRRNHIRDREILYPGDTKSCR